MSDLNISDLEDTSVMYNSLREYALVIDGEFIATIKYPSAGHAKIEAITAALQSNPVIVDVTDIDVPPSLSGWTWNGTTFSEPV